jgi:hypothetical protein
MGKSISELDSLRMAKRLVEESIALMDVIAEPLPAAILSSALDAIEHALQKYVNFDEVSSSAGARPDGDSSIFCEIVL